MSGNFRQSLVTTLRQMALDLVDDLVKQLRQMIRQWDGTPLITEQRGETGATARLHSQIQTNIDENGEAPILVQDVDIETLDATKIMTSARTDATPTVPLSSEPLRLPKRERVTGEKVTFSSATGRRRLSELIPANGLMREFNFDLFTYCVTMWYKAGTLRVRFSNYPTKTLDTKTAAKLKNAGILKQNGTMLSTNDGWTFKEGVELTLNFQDLRRRRPELDVASGGLMLTKGTYKQYDGVIVPTLKFAFASPQPPELGNMWSKQQRANSRDTFVSNIAYRDSGQSIGLGIIDIYSRDEARFYETMPTDVTRWLKIERQAENGGE